MNTASPSLPALRGRVPLWQAYLAATSVLCAAYVFVPPLKGSAPLMNLLGLSGVAAVAVGIRRNRPVARVAWWLFVVGLFLQLVGDTYTYSYRELAPATVPFPSWGDAVYLAVYPALMTGLLLLVRRRNREGDRPGVVDSLIMTLGLTLVVFVWLIAPYLHDPTLTLVPKLVSIAYPVGDIILLAAVIRLAIDAGARPPAFYLLVASIVTLLVTDFVYGVATLDNTYHHQLWMDAGWIFFYVLWGTAALHPSMRELERPAPDHRARLTPLRLALLTGASLIAPALLFATALNRHDVDRLVIISTSAVLFGLVISRMAGLVRARERSVARERTLTVAGGRLVAATSRRQIAAAALEAASSLAHAAVEARLCLRTRDGLMVFALDADADGGVMEWNADEAESVVLGGRDAVAELPSWARRALRLTETGDPASIFELPVRGVIGGALVLDGQVQAAISGVRTLATQVSLALESAELNDEMHRQASEAWISSLIQNSSDLITVLDSATSIVYQSPSIERVLGYRPEDVIGQPFETLLHPSEKGRLLRRLTDGGTAREQPELVECLLRHRDGSLRHFEVVHTDLLEDGAVEGIVLNGRDISERKAFEEQLAHQAFHDPVTQLPNRALFNERVRHAVARAYREQISLAVIFLDLDDFKTINDSLGHAAGDSVLLEVAKRVDASIRAGDTAARFGGDEFAVLLEDIEGPQMAAEVAERILELLAEPLRLVHKNVVVGASLGLSVAEPGSATNADELIRNADAAMYIAKGDGKGHYRLFEPAMHEQVLARLELRGDLQRALVGNQFELYFQPLVRLGDGTVTGLEALLRWNHPERGVIAPNEFIPLAEETGLIVPIGRWVLREGARQAQLIRAQTGWKNLSICVNVSVNQLFHSDIVADVRDALEAAGLEPSALTLELTESAIMTDTAVAVQRLNELKSLGVQLAMDDFGTGYSSLSYLSQLPIDTLKMDRSLLQAGAAPVTSGLASAVLGLAQTFNVAVVAEGIEHAAQRDVLRGLGCEIGQGFYFAKPMERDAVVEYLGPRAGDGRAAARSLASS